MMFVYIFHPYKYTNSLKGKTIDSQMENENLFKKAIILGWVEYIASFMPLTL